MLLMSRRLLNCIGRSPGPIPEPLPHHYPERDGSPVRANSGGGGSHRAVHHAKTSNHGLHAHHTSGSTARHSGAQASASTLAGEGCEPVTTTEARAGALFVTKYSDRRTPMLLRAVELFVLVLGAYYSVELMNNVPWYQMIFLGYPALTCCFTNWRGEEQEGAHITLSTAQVSSPTSVVADASKLGQRTIDSGVSPSTGPYSHAKGLQRSNGESTSTTNGPAGKGIVKGKSTRNSHKISKLDPGAGEGACDDTGHVDHLQELPFLPSAVWLQSSGRHVGHPSAIIKHTLMEAVFCTYLVGFLPIKMVLPHHLYYDPFQCALHGLYVFVSAGVLLILQYLFCQYETLCIFMGNPRSWQDKGCVIGKQVVGDKEQKRDGPVGAGASICSSDDKTRNQSSHITVGNGVTKNHLVGPDAMWVSGLNSFCHPEGSGHLHLIAVQWTVVISQLCFLMYSRRWTLYASMLCVNFVLLYLCIRANRAARDHWASHSTSNPLPG
mmetsp:Transcript_22332/g.42533  ORF Transcript_22332/g.42533 Transcript_22332/m.42533 type:complete len:495 (+) Transcript_22332:1-1485(+)